MDALTQSISALEPQDISRVIVSEKYCEPGEVSHQDVFERVVRGLARNSEESASFNQLMINGFIGGGRVMATSGTAIKSTLINCFVQPVRDEISSDMHDAPTIYGALNQAAETMRRGGGVGYNFSAIRPKGALVRTTQSMASGPVSYMHIFDQSCSTIESAGGRRGAQMGVLNISHPDIELFIHAKDGMTVEKLPINDDLKSLLQSELNNNYQFADVIRKGFTKLQNFNISVGITDDFMRAVIDDTNWDLVHDVQPHPDSEYGQGVQRSDGKWIYKTIRARELWDQIMQATYDHAEPGVIFLDSVNRLNNLSYCEVISASNPCGEQFLPDYGCCCLGSIILTRYVKNPFTEHAYFDFDSFQRDVHVAVRFLDRVLDVSLWPLKEQEHESESKRRIGLGFLGLGDALILLGLRYNSEEGRNTASKIAEAMRDAAYLSSIDLAREFGAFPLFDPDQYLASPRFTSTLPDHIKDLIQQYGIRNSHLLSIAPTGTISLAFADNASNGIEPAFSWVYNRLVRMPHSEEKRTIRVVDHALRVYESLYGEVNDQSTLPDYFVNAMNISALDHMGMCAAVAPYIDAAISKTVNVPADYPYEDFKDIYLQAWKAGLKGIATYRPNATIGSVLSVLPSPAPARLVVDNAPLSDCDPLRKQFDGRPCGDLESITSKIQYQTFEGKKTVYLTVSFINVEGVEDGQPVLIERPFEFFMPAGQKNDGQQWISASMRLLSMAARSGGSIAKALADLREVVWDKGTVRCGEITRHDGSVAPLFHESEVAAIGYALQRMLIKRGFLDADGNQVPVLVLSKKMTLGMSIEDKSEVMTQQSSFVSTGKKCNECGAYAVVKREGCEHCNNCHAVGSCG